MTTLRIRCNLPSQTATYLLQLYYEDTIGTLRSYLNKTLGEASQFDIRTTFPNRVLDNDTETLQACGLIPKCTLVLSAK